MGADGAAFAGHLKPTWGPNWGKDEDEGKGEFPNNHYFYLPRIATIAQIPPA